MLGCPHCAINITCGTGAIGWPALQAGYLIAISLLDSTGFTERPALKVGCLLAISSFVIPVLLENQGLYRDY